MNPEPLSLFFDTKEKTRPDLDVVAAASIAWTDTLRAIANQIDPSAELSIKFVDATQGSSIFNTLVHWKNVSADFSEDKIARLERGSGKHPRSRKLALALLPFLIITGIPTLNFYFGEKQNGLSDEDRELLDRLLDELNDKEKQKIETPRRRFYQTVQQDSNIIGVGASELHGKRPSLIIPSNRFDEYTGLWAMESDIEEESAERTEETKLDVVLISPALVKHPRNWIFKPDGLPEFHAIMKDASVLNAIAQDKGLGETMREGIPMRILIETKEKKTSGKWRLKPKGRSVLKVLSPRI